MSLAVSADPAHNLFLAALGSTTRTRLARELETVQLASSELLCDAGKPLRAAWFPTTAIVSLVGAVDSGASVELAMVGKEGMVGVPLVLAGEMMEHRAVVQSAGSAFRLRAEVLRWEFDQCGDFQRLALAYVRSLIGQIAQTALCFRLHGIDQQLSGWLLQCLDRLPDNQIRMTQVRIAALLGVRREAVTEAAVRLQAAGLISYSRGRIAVLDRSGLEARVCECYSALQHGAALNYRAPAAPTSLPRPRASPASLRQRAEQRLAQAPPPLPESAIDRNRMLHELQVHQIELEMHNEELARTGAEAEALRARCADIYDFSPVPQLSVGVRGAILHANLAGAILLGIKRSELTRHRFSHLVSPESRAEFNHFFDRVITSSRQEQCEISLVATEKRPEAFVHIDAVTDESGQECRMVLRDITRRRQAERALEASELRLQALIESLPDLVLAIDLNGIVTHFQPPAHLLGWAPPSASLLGRSYREGLPPAVAEALSTAMQEMGSSCGGPQHLGLSFESAGAKREFEATLTLLRGHGEQIAGYVCVAHDISDEIAARKHQQLLVTALESVADGVVITDALARIEWVNPAFETLSGYSRDEAMHRNPAELSRSGRQDPSFYASMWASVVAGKVWRGELVNLRKDRSAYDVELTITPVCNENGAIAHFVGVHHDISKRKQLEAELRTLAATDMLTGLPNRRQFMARLAEELARVQRNPSHQAALMILDLDHFKRINDRLGHPAGDKVLRMFAQLLGEELRKVDSAGRIGGEEFAVLLPETDLAAARIFGERLRAKVAEASCGQSECPATVTVSIGIAQLEPADADIGAVLSSADQALYQAKKVGRNRVELAPPRAPAGASE